MRENERAAQSFAIAAVRAKLTAFVVSGAVAGVGGALFVHLNQSFVVDSYGTGESFAVFTSAVIGGLGSLGGALLGAFYLRGTRGSSPRASGSCCRRAPVCCWCCSSCPAASAGCGCGSATWWCGRSWVAMRCPARCPSSDAAPTSLAGVDAVTELHRSCESSSAGR